MCSSLSSLFIKEKVLNEHQLPDVSALTVFLVTIGIYILFLLGFFVVPNFMALLFSLDNYKKSQRIQSEQQYRPQYKPNREFGFGKYGCVEEEPVYEPVETVYKPVQTPKPQTDSSIVQDAISVLVTLGYKKTEAKKLVVSASDGMVFTDVGELIKATMSRTNV